MTELTPSNEELTISPDASISPPIIPRVKRKYVRKAKPALPPVDSDSERVYPARFGAIPIGDKFYQGVTDEEPAAPPISRARQMADLLKLSPAFYREIGERFVVTYAGLLSLCMGSGELIYADARPVQEKDSFALDYGQQILQHAPWDGIEGAGALTGAWAQSVDKSGFKQIAYVAARDIPGRAGLTTGFTADEIFRKVALMDLIANSPLQLTAARLAMEAERA